MCMTNLRYHFLEIKMRAGYFLLSFIGTFVVCYQYSSEFLYIIARPFLKMSLTNKEGLINPSLAIPDPGILNLTASLNDAGFYWSTVSKIPFRHLTTTVLPCPEIEHFQSLTTGQTELILPSVCLELSNYISIKQNILHILYHPEIISNLSCLDFPFLASYNEPSLKFSDGFIFTDIGEAFSTILYTCFFSSCIILFPFSIYHIWCFFAPSCYTRELYKARLYLVVGIITLGGGGLFIYNFLLPWLCGFFLGFEINTGPLTVQLQARIGSYIKWSSHFFMTTLPIFQVPLFLIFALHRRWIEDTTVAGLASKRTGFWVLAVLLSSVISPPHIQTQTAITLLFGGIFESIIWIAHLSNNTKQIYSNKHP